MKLFYVLISLLLFTACASVTPPYYPPEPGVEYLTASWYGPKFHGRPTASGERFNMHAFTAAHKTLKFGTRLRVTNPDTGKFVVVTVNDRGPFIRGRDLDLSYGAAQKIGFVEKGVGRVRVEYVTRDMRYVRRVPFEPGRVTGPLTVQVGAFTDRFNAFRLKQGLELSFRDVYVTEAVVKGEVFYRVRVGEFEAYDSAYTHAQRLADEGYPTVILTRD
ncbi:MAG: septal ring lytic transglycosylase RlpA family protein [Nitrospiraceae bacterium]|nr:MAG: septal ring lytic transglycosylase RlpA family protein [Nitrospiraceae bacterium]